MTDGERRAGTGQLNDGGTVTWSVADGRRGRRWRWTVTDGEMLRHAGLIELDPGRRLTRLELSSRFGSLTLHPDHDGRTISGNVVTAEGVRALSFAWDPRAAVEIAVDAFATAILATGEIDGTLLIRPKLGVVAGAGSARLPLDDRGIPRLAEAREWPLELEG